MASKNKKEKELISQLTIEDLVTLLYECGDQDNSVNIDPNKKIIDISFVDLGYDSLSIFNVIIRIEQDFKVQLMYDDIAQAKTPRSLLKMINDCLQAIKQKEKICVE